MTVSTDPVGPLSWNNGQTDGSQLNFVYMGDNKAFPLKTILLSWKSFHFVQNTVNVCHIGFTKW